MQELTHDKNRLNVCILCYRKGKRSLSGKGIEPIRELIIEDYDVENPCLPAGICEGCHLLLNFKSNGTDVKLPNVDYETTILPRLLRSLSTTPCNCRICVVATCKGKDAQKLKKKPGRPRTKEIPTESTLKVCAHVLQGFSVVTCIQNSTAPANE